MTLTSRRLGLVGRPDRLVKSGGLVVAEEWKSSRSPRAWHRAQLGVYFLLLEEETGVRPTYGVLVCGRPWLAEAAAGNPLNGIVSGRRRRLRERQSASVLRIQPYFIFLVRPHEPCSSRASPFQDDQDAAVAGHRGEARRARLLARLATQNFRFAPSQA